MKELVVAYLLWFFLGFYGAHKFYLGRTGTGVFYLFTAGGFVIGWFIDLFTLPKQVRNANILYANQYSRPAPYIRTESRKPKPLSPKEKDKIVLLIAKEYNGRLTPLEIAANSDLSIDESEEILKKWSSKGYADLKVSDSGTIYYEFSGFLSADERNQANRSFLV
ncbi:MAG TPA: TM2 domain-containing protein [Spirochaetes bacterium]|nr:TM2 domain-containing protein [Spirochaetota bacterium]